MTVLPADERPRSRPRLRLNIGQVLLGLALIGLLVALGLTTQRESQEHREIASFVQTTESTTTNVAVALRDGLSHAITVERWLAGMGPRRDWQVTRALLAQRLSVTDTSGRAGAESLPSPFLSRLAALDQTLRDAPRDALTEAQQRQWRRAVSPALEAFSSAARQLAGAFTAFDAERRALALETATSEQRLAQLLFASVVVASILFAWVAWSTVRRHRESRRALEDDERRLAEARLELARASELDGGQSLVLRSIAGGVPTPEVLQQIANLAARVTGRRSAVTMLDGGWTGLPHPSQVAVGPTATEVLWSGTFGEHTGDAHGQLALMGPPGSSLDPEDREVADRCLQLASLLIARDQAAHRLTHQAMHDTLTGLGNRRALLERLGSLLAEPGDPVAVLFCDLDGFKPVNDSLGHKAGDRLLVEAAGRLQAACRADDLVCRLGGDEFVVVSRTGRDGATGLAGRISAAFDPPFSPEGAGETFVGVSIGIATADSAADRSPSALLRDADVAMYQAKRRPDTSIATFDAGMQAEAAHRLEVSSALHSAIRNGELRLTVQPIVRLDTGRQTGAEALVRWMRPRHGETQPADFIHLAEENGLVVDIGRWVLRESLRWLAARHAAGDTHLTVSVNVAARQLRDPSFEEDVLAALLESGTDPSALVLELTESSLIDPALAQGALARLRAVGVRVALDDFGTGYSSLTQLRDLPVDVVKLDRSFVSPLSDDATQGAVIAAVVRLADALGLTLVVEGVETEQERARLLDLGCGQGQGFLFGHPEPATPITPGARAPHGPTP